jgi:hypothetical protein
VTPERAKELLGSCIDTKIEPAKPYLLALIDKDISEQRETGDAGDKKV